MCVCVCVCGLFIYLFLFWEVGWEGKISLGGLGPRWIRSQHKGLNSPVRKGRVRGGGGGLPCNKA